MRPWQKEVYTKLASGTDIYVAPSPGGGKTLPYICYWLDHIISLNTSRQDDRTWKSFSDTINNLYKMFGFF